MDYMLAFLFPYQPLPRRYNLALLILRLLFGGLLMWHGVSKVMMFEELSASFPDPIGFGGQLSLYLTIFVEVVCSVAVIFGAFYRLALMPILF